MRRKVTGRGKNVAAAIAMCAALIATQASWCDAQASTITLSPGANIQSAVNANPNGTTFILRPGVYRMQAVTLPKLGDTFTGQTGADLNGSTVLTNWVQSGAYWIKSGAPALQYAYGDPALFCMDPTTGCVYQQDLYLNNKPLVHKLALPITSGQWYFDYANDVVYMADNPAGQTVELGVTPQAFNGYANNVTIQNLIVEKYATPLMQGAIGGSGSNWIIKSNEARLNHGAGIKPQYGPDYAQVLSNNVHDNGQAGISIGGGTGVLVEYNTVSGNDYADVVSEAGGGKVAGTINAQVLNNTYTNNKSVGLWSDSGATGSIFSGNTISGNQTDGIRFEVSHYGTVSNNTLTNNVQDPVTGSCTKNAREIVLSESDNTVVSGNTITSNCAGITMTQGHRNFAVNNSVLRNTITYAGTTLITNRIGGIDPPPATLYDPANHNSFNYNTYHLSSPTMPALTNWDWQGPSGSMSALNWSGWQAAGQDVNGTAQ